MRFPAQRPIGQCAKGSVAARSLDEQVIRQVRRRAVLDLAERLYRVSAVVFAEMRLGQGLEMLSGAHVPQATNASDPRDQRLGRRLIRRVPGGAVVRDHRAHREVDLPDLLASFAVFAYPSRFEGLCVAVLEAQAAGVQVVATPVGGIRETVVGQTAMAARAVDLARELGVLDRGVLFNLGWTPYEERQAYLLEADVGVSAHFESLETHFAFRTRLLDYFWTGRPRASRPCARSTRGRPSHGRSFDWRARLRSRRARLTS